MIIIKRSILSIVFLLHIFSMRFFFVRIEYEMISTRENKNGYSTPCANIITNPGSTITSSFICGLSQLNTNTACLPDDEIKKIQISLIS